MRHKAVHSARIFAGLGLACVSSLAAQSSSCDMKPGHFLVNSAVLYLRNADSTKFPDVRVKNLRDANRVLTQALANSDQQKNPAAWYYLGKYYIEMKDAPGADTAFAKAIALAPRCKDEINGLRRNLWVPVLNAGIAAWQAGNADSAIATFRRANQLYDAEPTGFVYLATLFAGAHQTDSAAKYFKLAAQAATDPKFAPQKKDAMFNLARVYHAANRYDEAAAAYEAYLAAYPRDVQATAGLAGLYAQTGKKDQAAQLYRQILERADSAEPADLFMAGRELLNGIPKAPDTAATGSSCRSEQRGKPGLTPHRIAVRCDSVTAKAMAEYQGQVQGSYRTVEQAFSAGLAKQAYDREALFTMAGVASLAGDTARALDAAQRLYALDPLNRSTLRMVAQAWKLKGNTDSTLHFLQRSDSLALEVSVGGFTPDDKGAAMSGLFTNLRSKPTQPGTLTFEFLDKSGKVVSTHQESVPSLGVGENRPFDFKATGAGITAWRYRR